MNIEKMDKLQDEWSTAYVNSNKRCTLHLAPRTGKIHTTIKVWRKLGWENSSKKILISYPDNKILRSWKDDIQKCNFQGCIFYFTNISSLGKYVGDTFDMFVYDECHEGSDREIKWIKEISKTSEYVLGLSGTINEWSERILNSLGIPILIRYPIEMAVKDEIISEYEIFIHLIDLDTKVKTKNSKGRMVSEKTRWDNLSYVITKKEMDGEDTVILRIKRKKLSSESIAKRKKVRELLTKMKNERLLVFTGLQKVAEDLDIPFYHSKCKTDETFQQFVNEEIDQLAMVNIGGIGVTYKNMDAIILANFTHNEENTEQIIARALVMDYKSKVAKIHILCLNEKDEINKLKKTVKNFNKSKIKYV